VRFYDGTNESGRLVETVTIALGTTELSALSTVTELINTLSDSETVSEAKAIEAEAKVAVFETNRVTRVISKALANLSFKGVAAVEGLLKVDLASSYDSENPDAVASSIDLWKEFMERAKTKNPSVLFSFYSSNKAIEVPLELNVASAEMIGNYERRGLVTTITGIDEIRNRSAKSLGAYVSVKGAQDGYGYSVFSTANYAVYLLGLTNLKERNQKLEASDVDEPVVREVLRLAGNPVLTNAERDQMRNHILSFAQGIVDTETLRAAERFSVQPLLPLLSARVNAYMVNLRTAGISA
jgi:hypothetical protein